MCVCVCVCVSVNFEWVGSFSNVNIHTVRRENENENDHFLAKYAVRDLSHFSRISLPVPGCADFALSMLPDSVTRMGLYATAASAARWLVFFFFRVFFTFSVIYMAGIYQAGVVCV